MEGGGERQMYEPIHLSRQIRLKPEADGSIRIPAELGDLNSTYRMSDGRTIEDYLALSEEQRATLWEDAFREAMAELEKM
jgi:hypothetical protein